MTSGCTVSETGLDFTDGISYAEWEAVGYSLARAEKAWQWWVGDWINFGEKKYGETYKAAVEATGLSLGACMNIASVCSAFETSRRREVLSFKHHTEVQSLEPSEQDELLDAAESESLSCAKLRQRVKEHKGEYSGEDTPKEPEQTNWSEKCVDAFRKAENRIEALRLIWAELEDYERNVMLDFIQDS